MCIIFKKYNYHSIIHIIVIKNRLYSYFKESFPLRFQGFHFINEPLYLYTVYSIIKPFLKEKLRCRVSFSLIVIFFGVTLNIFLKVHFHGSNFNSLHKYIAPNILPTYFGGNLEFDPLTWVQQLLSKEQYLKGTI